MKNHHTEVLARIAQTSTIIPDHRSAFRQGYSFSVLPFDEQLAIWNYIWKAGTGFYPRLHAFLFLEKYMTKPEHHAALWETSVSWQNDVTDWPLCDSLSKINTRALEQYPDEVYTQLVAWNTDADLWKRRQSIVSLLYYARTKKVFLPYKKIEALVRPLLADGEYYVQKGVGWTLREMFNAYPEETYAFMQKNIKGISAIAFTAAVEKMTIAQKDALKAIRR